MEHPAWFLVEFTFIAVKTLTVLAVVYLAAKWAQRRYGRGNGQ
jgi:hypothetical protein